MNPRITRLWGADGALSMVGITYRKGAHVVLVTIRRDEHHHFGGWIVQSSVWSGWVPNMRRAFSVAKMYATLRIADKECAL